MEHEQDDRAADAAIPDVALPGGETMPALGLGTWQMGEMGALRGPEVAALRFGLDLGIRLIDTAEMYGSGGAEEVVGAAAAGRRDEVFLVSKVLPENAGRGDMAKACESSLRRLGTDRIDLYLLHWRGQVPLEETVAGFDDLSRAGKIRYWGVSNFDLDDMRELEALGPAQPVACNQILYNLCRRGIEWDLLPWCRERGIPVCAYAPLEQGKLPPKAELVTIAERHGASSAQVALAWLLRQPGLQAIPKSSRLEHVRQNRAAAALAAALDDNDLALLDRAYPPPRGPRPLEMI